MLGRPHFDVTDDESDYLRLVDIFSEVFNALLGFFDEFCHLRIFLLQ